MMSLDNQITPNVKNLDIHNAYINTCSTASALILNITSKRKVNKKVFNNFKGCFISLFVLTGQRREFNNLESLVKRVSDWVNVNITSPTEQQARDGILLFTEYQKEMIRCELINDKN